MFTPKPATAHSPLHPVEVPFRRVTFPVSLSDVHIIELCPVVAVTYSLQGSEEMRSRQAITENLSAMLHNRE